MRNEIEQEKGKYEVCAGNNYCDGWLTRANVHK